ncbi:hypothetical protein Tco_0274753 [Tanacetum coccineum]
MSHASPSRASYDSNYDPCGDPSEPSAPDIQVDDERATTPEQDVSIGRIANSPRLSPTTVLPPPQAHQGPYQRPTARIRVADPSRVTYRAPSPYP